MISDEVSYHLLTAASPETGSLLSNLNADTTQLLVVGFAPLAVVSLVVQLASPLVDLVDVSRQETAIALSPYQLR